MSASKNLVRNVCASALALALLFPAAPSLEAAGDPEKKAFFDDHNTPNIAALLPMPPDAGSQEDMADREASFAVYSTRTPEQFARGKAQKNLTVFNFAPSKRDWFKKGKLPKTEALFAQLEREVKALTDKAKKYYQRPRPAQVDSKRFADVISKEDTGSYPSCHSTHGTLYALLLIELFPHQRAALHAQGREAGWLRVQGGMETPLDVYAGRVLGRTLAHALMRNPAFLSEFEAVRDELVSAAAAAAAEEKRATVQ